MNHGILGLAGSTAKHAADFAARNEIPAHNGDYSIDGLLANPGIDAVYISSTNEQHLAHAAAAARPLDVVVHRMIVHRDRLEGRGVGVCQGAAACLHAPAGSMELVSTETLGVAARPHRPAQG